MNLSFRRIISRGSFIPEIDGLRFIAIASVLLYHLSAFILQEDLHVYDTEYDFSVLQTLLARGYLGVPLFFIISGFILGRPFAKYYIEGGRKVELKSYFTRRLTRLEPPYILVMTALLFGAVYVAGNLGWAEALPSYLASLTYTHNFIYPRDTLPLLNAVAWSLEVEVQFYVLAPLIALLFSFRRPSVRRLFLIVATVFWVLFDHFVETDSISILNHFEYFFLGFLLADLYVSDVKLWGKTKFDSALSLLLFSMIWAFDKQNMSGLFFKIGWDVLQLGCIFFFYYLVIFHKSTRALTWSIVTNIGGMCYSIYLLHFAIMSLIGSPLMAIDFTGSVVGNTIIYATVQLAVVMIVSAAFFLLIERPCMNKEWPKKSWMWLKGMASSILN